MRSFALMSWGLLPCDSGFCEVSMRSFALMSWGPINNIPKPIRWVSMRSFALMSWGP